MRYAILALVLSVPVACSPVDAPVRCTPNGQNACVCSGGRPGTQTCEAGGASYTPCVCPGDMADVPQGDAVEVGTDAGASEDRAALADVVDAAPAIDAFDAPQGGDVADAGVGDAQPVDAVDVLDEGALCRIRCGPSAVCIGTSCQCTGSAVLCGSACRVLDADTENCGACGRRCAAGFACAGGLCIATLASGMAVCDGVRTDLRADRRNCGACANACPTGRICVDAVCLADNPMTACDSTHRDCDRVTANGCETNIREDAENCGGCNNRCAVWQICDLGRCLIPSCLYCDGVVCSPVRIDPQNCGRCGVACAPWEMCRDGVCR